MNVSLKWLGTLVDIKGLDADQMAETLTVDGIPVEHVVRPGIRMKGIITGKILKVEKHPNADHLVVCQIDIGEEEPTQIVTSADNVRAGQIVPCALPGAHVPGKHDRNAPGGIKVGDVKIKKGKMRGVPSNGMMCSASEMLFDTNLFPGVDREGIMILPEDTPVGIDFHKLYDLDDVVYEMELTPNRADCFSMVGMAKETAAIFKRKLSLPKIEVKEEAPAIEGRASVNIAEPEFCKRFSGRLLENVKITGSPEWMRNRLRSNGIRPINNVVDTANYVMLELGQPLHTYDYDKVAGHSLTLRHAKEGEEITTLDSQERKLTAADLVIADETHPVCIAGVMGGLDSEVTESTTSVLLEAAVFDKASVRRTSRRLGLRSEASGRYEKGVNPEGTVRALDRFCQLMVEQGAATIAKGVLDVYPAPEEPRVIDTTLDAINGYIGINLPDEQIIDILERLYFTVKTDGRKISVVVPAFRGDVEGMPDLAEEVARVYGYANIPNTTPWSAIVEGSVSKDKAAVLTISDTLIAHGLSEVVNYSFMHTDDLKKLNFAENDEVFNAIPILNPISEEYPYTRTTLLPGLMHTLKYNLAQKNENIAIFESGIVYHPKALPLTELPVEEMQISALLCGTPDEEGYPNSKREYDFYDVKGIVEDVLSALGIKDYTIERSHMTALHPGVSADFVKDGKVIASFGEMHPAALTNFGVKRTVFAVFLSIPALDPFITDSVRYEKIPKFPASARDLAILVPAELSNQQVEEIIRKHAGRHLEELRLFDLYQGEQVPEGYKSMAYNLSFRVADHTLTDEEVDGWIKKIVKALNENNCTLRA